MHTSSLKIFVCGVVLLVAVVVAVVLLFVLNSPDSNVAPEHQAVGTGEENPAIPAPTIIRTSTIPDDTELDTSEAGVLVADVWELCNLDELPIDADTWEQFTEILGVDFELSEDCLTALEKHLYTVNPFTWRAYHSEFSFIVLEDSFTFARAFTDPEDSLQLVIEALDNPDCWLDNGTKINWELKDTCHAEAFINYAEFYHTCYGLGAVPQLVWADPPTTELFEQMWKTHLEEHWVEQHCAKFGPELAIHQVYPEQFEKLFAIIDSRQIKKTEFSSDKERQHYEFLSAIWTEPSNQQHLVYQTMLELASRLGDPTASLTHSGKPFGQLSGILTSKPWQELRSLKTLSKERVEQALTFINLLEHLEVDFNWDWLVEHLCSVKSQSKSGDQLSCRSLIYDLYTVDKVEGRRLELVNKFEKVATKLGVYE